MNLKLIVLFIWKFIGCFRCSPLLSKDHNSIRVSMKGYVLRIPFELCPIFQQIPGINGYLNDFCLPSKLFCNVSIRTLSFFYNCINSRIRFCKCRNCKRNPNIQVADYLSYYIDNNFLIHFDEMLDMNRSYQKLRHNFDFLETSICYVIGYWMKNSMVFPIILDSTVESSLVMRQFMLNNFISDRFETCQVNLGRYIPSLSKYSLGCMSGRSIEDFIAIPVGITESKKLVFMNIKYFNPIDILKTFYWNFPGISIVFYFHHLHRKFQQIHHIDQIIGGSFRFDCLFLSFYYKVIGNVIVQIIVKPTLRYIPYFRNERPRVYEIFDDWNNFIGMIRNCIQITVDLQLNVNLENLTVIANLDTSLYRLNPFELGDCIGDILGSYRYSPDDEKFYN